jgi:hypothetical protein
MARAMMAAAGPADPPVQRLCRLGRAASGDGEHGAQPFLERPGPVQGGVGLGDPGQLFALAVGEGVWVLPQRPAGVFERLGHPAWAAVAAVAAGPRPATDGDPRPGHSRDCAAGRPRTGAAGHAPAGPTPRSHPRAHRSRHAQPPSSRLPTAQPITWHDARRSPAASVLTVDKPEPRRGNGVRYSRRAEPTHGSVRRASNALSSAEERVHASSARGVPSGRQRGWVLPSSLLTAAGSSSRL